MKKESGAHVRLSEMQDTVDGRPPQEAPKGVASGQLIVGNNWWLIACKPS